MSSAVIGAGAVAVAAAAVLGTAAVAQRRAALDVPVHAAGSPRLVAALVRRRWWWIGTAASVAGLLLQVLALALGPIIVVQSAMTSSIVFTVVAERLLSRHRLPTGAWAGAGLTGLGLVGLLVALDPTAGDGAVPPAGSTLAVAGGCLVIMLAAVAWSRLPALPGTGAQRVLAVAVATGLGYGLTAVQLKAVGSQLAAGVVVPLLHPALFVALVLGPSAILLSQAALQQGRLAAAVVPVILVVDALVGLVAGLFWFGERVGLGTDTLPCAIVLLVGVVVTQRGSRHAAPTARAGTRSRRQRVAAAEPSLRRQTSNEAIMAATHAAPRTYPASTSDT